MNVCEYSMQHNATSPYASPAAAQSCEHSMLRNVTALALPNKTCCSAERMQTWLAADRYQVNYTYAQPMPPLNASGYTLQSPDWTCAQAVDYTPCTPVFESWYESWSRPRFWVQQVNAQLADAMVVRVNVDQTSVWERFHCTPSTDHTQNSLGLRVDRFTVSANHARLLEISSFATDCDCSSLLPSCAGLCLAVALVV
jgi:hypothetical protein